nr:DUF4238 domain-containing protein [Cryobacterium sp. CG_9.6]
MGETKKLHHYVPQAYLRGFATEKERVTAIKLPGDTEPFTTIVRNVAAQNHFHRIEGLDQPDKFEDVLSEIEGAALTVIRKLEAGAKLPLSEADRWTLAYFISLQAVRGPDTRRTIEMIQRQMVRLEVGAGGRKNIAAWAKKNLGFEPNEAQAQRLWNEATRVGGPPITLSNWAHIQHMMEMALEMLPYITARPWTLVSFTNRSLITGDSPVTLIRDAKDAPHDGVGFATAWGIAFPLTRKLGLLMSDPMVAIENLSPDDPRIGKIWDAVSKGQADHREVGTTAMEKLFNEHTALNASEYLYRHPDDARFVPKDLHGPQLVNVSMSGADMQFTGAPWFGLDSEEAVI